MKKIISSITGLAMVFAFVVAPAMAASVAVDGATIAVSSNLESASADYTLAVLVNGTVTPDASATMTFTFGTALDASSVVFGDADIIINSTDTIGAGGTDQTVAAAAGDAIWGFTISNTVVTITAPTVNMPALTDNTYIVVKIGTNATGGSNQIINSAAGTNVVTVGGTMSASQLAAVVFTSAANSSISVTATIQPILTFALGTNTLALGDLTAGVVTSANTTVTVATNATSGYTATVVNTSAGLANGGGTNDGSNTDDEVEPVGASTTGATLDGYTDTTEAYGFRMYGGHANTVTFGTDVDAFSAGVKADKTYQPLSNSGVTAISYSNPTASTATNVEIAVNSAATTPAGSYSDTLTFVVSGNF